MAVAVSESSVSSLFRDLGALLEGHFRLSSGSAQSGLSAVRARAAASGACRGARARRWPSSCGDLRRDRRAVAGAGRRRSSATRSAARSACARSSPSDRTAALTLRRGFTLTPADRVVVIEDVMTTGGSTRETMAVATRGGRDGRRRRRDHRSQRRRARTRRAVSIARHAQPADLPARALPALRRRAAGHEAGVQKVGKKGFQGVLRGPWVRWDRRGSVGSPARPIERHRPRR